jgi:hypothetical protein
MGNHTHGGTTGSSDETACSGNTPGSAARGGHTHTFTTGGPSVPLTDGPNTTGTGAAESLPPYLDVLFCRKS